MMIRGGWSRLEASTHRVSAELSGKSASTSMMSMWLVTIMHRADCAE